MTAPARRRGAEQRSEGAAADVRGVLEVISGGSGFLRSSASGFQSSPEDVFVPQNIIRRFRLKTGDVIEGEAGAPPGRGKSAPLLKVNTVSGIDPEAAAERPDFTSRPAAHPA
jgi:transcription termination factor Rho